MVLHDSICVILTPYLLWQLTIYVFRFADYLLHVFTCVSRFYIGCDRCNDWFHGSCVGITKQEADSIDTYLCPRCNDTQVQENFIHEKLLEDRHWPVLGQLHRELKVRGCMCGNIDYTGN